MSFPVQITYRAVDSSEALDRLIRDEAAKLGKFFDGILRCRALIERQSAHHHAGSPFRVRLTLALPGFELVVDAEPSLRAIPFDDEPLRVHKSDEIDAVYKDPALTIREAFRRARRRMQAYVQRNLGTHAR